MLNVKEAVSLNMASNNTLVICHWKLVIPALRAGVVGERSVSSEASP